MPTTPARDSQSAIRSIDFSDVPCDLGEFSLRPKASNRRGREGYAETPEKGRRCTAGFLVLLALLFGVPHARAQGTLPVSFLARMDTPLPTSPLAKGIAAAADLNSDGELDLVVSGDQNDIWVFFGIGDGTFQPAVTYTIRGASFYALADFNGDGKQDIFAVGGSTVYVMLNNGDGTFAAPVATTITTNAPGIFAIGDFNGDGKADISVPVSAPANGYSSVSILLGNGDGTFQAPINSSSSVPTPAFAQVADFNRDGKLDILWSTSLGYSVFLGNGNGTVQKPLTTGFPPYLLSFPVVVADFNDDGIPDFATASWLYPGNGDGTFGTPIQIQGGGGLILQLLAGDFNHDGEMDILESNGGTVNVFLGNGDGTFQQPTYSDVPGNAIAIGDFNGDGILDVVGSSIPASGSFSTLGVFTVALGEGNGNFSTATILSECTFGICLNGTVTLADLNGDGLPDLIYLGAAGDYVYMEILLANPNGGYQNLGTVSVSNEGAFANDDVADFNKDGKVDLAVTAGPALGILLGNGNGGFQSEVTYGNTTPSFVAVGDFHGNGNLDVVTADTSGDTVSLFPGNGDGTFGFSTSFPAGSEIAGSLVVADFNNDGKLDVALANGNILFGNGNGTFGSPVSSYPTGGSIQTADFNNDGIPDLALTTSTGVEVMLGHGDGTFGSPKNFTLGYTPGTITASDFNRDGKKDIAVGTGSDVVILLGNGDGTFQLAPGYFAADDYLYVGNLVAVDATGDGYPDIYTGSGSFLVNRPKGALATASPKTLNFGNLGVGNKQTGNVTFFNVSQVKVPIGSLKLSGPNAHDFSIKNGCGSSVGPGAQCAIGVTFTPSAVGARSASLTITANDADSPHVVALTGFGAGLGLVVPAGGSSSATVSAGQTAKYVLSIGDTGFTGTATLSCTGAPTGATCSLPSSVNVSATKATQFNVSVSTTAATMGSVVPQRFRPSPWLWAVAIVGMLIFPAASQNKRALRRLALVLPLGIILGISSCGGGGGGGNGGTPTGTYTVTVTATSGTLRESLQLKLTVQ